MLTSRTVDGQRTFDRAYSAAEDPPSKRKIMQAALHLFALKGIHAVSVRDIANEAGYTNPALFKFFPTKDALAQRLFECCYLQLFQRLSAASRSDLSFRERLKAILDVFILQVEQDPEAFLFIQDHLREIWPRLSRQTRRKSILNLIRSTLEQGVREGTVSSTLNLDLMVAAFTGTLQQFARMLHFGEFKRQPRDWAPEIELTIRRIVGP